MLGDMKLLVLGGSAFVGRAVVEEGVARGYDVTTFNRGRGWAHPAATALHGDRLDWPGVAGEWDLVVDTWAQDPAAVAASANGLRDQAGKYVYISSCSVYAPPPKMGADESTPTVEPGADDYASVKRGGEVAVLDAFGTHRTTLLRPGLILGPHEDVGRLPWWLQRLARGGETLAPGPQDLPLQLIDARDLAAFALDAPSGTYNAISRRGHTTMSALLEAAREVAGSRATLRWVDPTILAQHDVEAWTELPIWLPPDHEYAALHGHDVERAHAAGLTTRPAEDTVRDTWAWLTSLDGPPPLRADLPPHGIAPDKERAILQSF
jgi:2'-hydroxyisoflavone reductase